MSNVVELTSKRTPSTDLVTVEDGVPMTTSLVVAEKFKKMHKHVLEAIRDLEVPDLFRESNFRLSEYSVPGQSRKYPVCHMTRDGFTFLAMGFTGKEAAKWKISYINAFNAMEAALKAPNLTLEQAIRLASELKSFTDAQLSFVERLSGVPVDEFRPKNPAPEVDIPKGCYLTVSKLGKLLEIGPNRVNLLLEKAGLQEKRSRFGWRPTEKGKRFCRVASTTHGGWLKWLPETKDYLIRH